LDLVTPDTPPEAPPALQPYTQGPFKGLTPNVIRLGWVSFFADISSEMLYPLTPLFLTLVLGAPMAALGLIEGVAEATASLLKTVSGRMSDRAARRKPFVLFGYTLSALAKPLLALAHGWPIVLVARVGDRFGKGVRSAPRDALLADSVTPAVRGRAYGWHRAMDTAGAVIGPPLGLALVLLAAGVLGHGGPGGFARLTLQREALEGPLRLAFLFAVIPGIIGALFVLFVAEKPHDTRAKPAPLRLAWGELSKPFRGYLLGWGAFALANSSDIFLIVRAGKLGYSLPVVVLLYAFYNVVYAVASPTLGHLSDRVGRKTVLVGGLLVFAAVYLGFAFVNDPLWLWPLFAVYGLYIAATDGVGKALAVDLAPADQRASALGLLGTVSGVAALVASVTAGLLWDHVGPWAAFAYGAAGAVAGALLIGALTLRKPTEQI
jgi:MFS family permease